MLNVSAFCPDSVNNVSARDCAGKGLEDGIHATRMLFPRLWFDQTRCKAGLEALAHYQREFNKRLSEYKATPVHNWASHGADALRTMGVAHRTARIKQPKASWPPMQAGGGAGHGWMGT